MNSSQQIFISAAVTALLCLAAAAPSRASDTSCGPMSPAEEQLIKLQQERDLLLQKVSKAESFKGISVEQLRLKKAQRLKDIAADLRIQRQATSDFESFVKWMSANLAGYNKYIQAGSYAALAARVLPIPYAGQASVFAKFVAQFTVALNEASVAITNYLTTSQKYLAMTDAIDLQKSVDEKTVGEAARFADQKLLHDMQEAQLKLATVSDLSTGALAFLESLSHYVSGTDEYWNKVKGVFKKDIDPKEKSFISESAANLKNQAARFNSRLKSFEDLGRKETSGVKALAVYDELAVEARNIL